MIRSPDFQAALCALAASAILGLTDNFVAPTAVEAGLWQFHVVRALFALPLFVLLSRLLGLTLMPRHPARWALRSVIVAAGLLMYFAALGSLTVAQAGAGLFSAPIWVLILSAVAFGARYGKAQIAAVMAGFGGALMVLQPDPEAVTAVSFLALASGAFYGAGMLLTRHLCADESPLALAAGVFGAIVLFSLCMLALNSGSDATGFLTRAWAPVTPRFLGLTLFQAVGAVIAVSLLAQAYRIGQAARVAVFEYSFLVFAALWALVLGGAALNPLGWAGIGVILASALLVARLGQGPRAQARS